MIRNDRRAVSVAITHALTIAVTTIAISTLLIGAGGLLDDQQNRVAREQLTEIGSDVVSHINSLDRLAATGDTVDATVRPTYPTRVVGQEYSVSILHESSSDFPFGTDHALSVRSTRLNSPIQFPLRTNVNLAAVEVEGGPLAICLDAGDITLGRNCS